MNDEKDSVAELLRIAGRRPKVSDEVKARVFAAVHGEWQNEVRSRRRRRVFAASGLATAAAIVAVFFLRPLSQPGSVIETAGETRLMKWGNVSLHLDAGTRIRLLSDHVAALEKGTILVATANRGVEIRTPFGSVHDIGTRFEVRLTDDDVRVRVSEGRVELRGAIVAAGGEVTATQSKVETKQWSDRATPLITIEGLTFEQVIDRVAREKKLTVEWSKGTRKVKRLHGVVPLSPDEALDAATAAAGVNYTIAGKRLIIR